MFPVRGWLTALSAVAVVVSGCLGPMADLDGFEENEPFLEPEQEIVVDSKEFEASVAALWLPLEGEQQITPDWELSLPLDTDRLSLHIAWEDPVNDYTFVLETPEGEERWDLESDMMQENHSWNMDLQDPSEGDYLAYVVAETVLQEDRFFLKTEWQYTVGLPGRSISPVVFDEEGNAWRATLPYRATGEVTGTLDLDVDTFNGRIEVVATEDDKATARLHPWGRAATQERAEELARSVRISLSIDGSDLKAHAAKDPDMSMRDKESVGASIQIHVPVKVTGSLKSSNGRIELDDLAMSDLKAKTSNGRIVAEGRTSGDLTLETSNGRIMADLEGSGDILLDTSNGRIELDLVPTGDTELSGESSNGRMVYRLKESSDIGYDLDAGTSNSKISNKMDEAEWKGSKKEGSLRTPGFSDRKIQVTGDLRTSNGSIEFNGT